MPSFLHAADLHLDSPMSGLEAYEGAPLEEIRGATRRALEQLVTLAIDEAVDLLLLAGDIYDGDWRDYNTGLFFAAQMARLKEAEIPVMVVNGNHDAASQISRHLRLPDNVHLFSSRQPETRRLDNVGLAIHGQGYPRRQVEENLARAYPSREPGAFNIGLLHTSLDGRPGHANYAPCHLDDLRRLGYDYWALGHVHQREVVAQDPWVVFPGNLQGRHARETGAKGATLVRIQDGRVAGLEHHAMDVVRWAVCDLRLQDPLDLERLEDAILREINSALAEADGRLLAVRLRLHGRTRLDGEIRAHAEQLLNQCRVHGLETVGSGIWIEKLVVATEPTPRSSIHRAAVSSSPTPDAFPDETSLAPLLETILDPHSLNADAADAPPAPAISLLEDIDALARKLPASMQTGPDALAIDLASLTREDGELHQALQDARALLLDRLFEQPPKPS